MRAIVPERIETARMLGERLAPEHAPELARLGLDPRVARWLWPFPQPPTAAEVRAGIERLRAEWERDGLGVWFLRDRATGAPVGRGGLRFTEVDGERRLEVAWLIAPERWGEGLATELAHHAVGVAFETLGAAELVALTLPDNRASRRVMEKAGFAYARHVVHAGLDHVLYHRGKSTSLRV